MKLNFAMFLGLPLLYLWADVYEVLEMIFLIAYCMYMLTMHKRLSVWSFLIVGFTTFVLRMLTSYYHAKQEVYGLYGSQDIAIALTEILYCFAKFLLIWGVLFIIRKCMNQREFFIKRSTLKAVICLFVLTLFFFLNFSFEYIFIMDKPYIYQRVCDFWASVIPEFYWVDYRTYWNTKGMDR